MAKKESSSRPIPRGVVYKITCACGENYIGETARPINIRINEHISSVQKSDGKSAISDHIAQHPDHTIDWKNIKIINKHQDNYKTRKLIEAINIKKHKPTLNRDQGLFIPSAYDNI